MPEISIIVPVYNVEKYLKKCIDSILNQTFTDFELILVDDGSTDNSVAICDKYVNMDNRIKVIHKENCGVSAARNTGVESAIGNYIGFVDNDDYIDKDMYELLYNDIISEGADISICGMYECFKDKMTKQSKVEGRYVFNNIEALKEVMESKIFSVNPVNKLYKKDLFKGLKYPDGKLSEDAFITPLLIMKAKKVVFNSEAKYYYVRRMESITTSGFKQIDFSVVEAYRGHFEWIKEKLPELKPQAEFRYLWSYFCVLDKMILSNKVLYNKEDFNKIVKIIRKNIINICFNKCFSLKRKLAAIILFFNKKIYKKLTIKNHEKNFKLFSVNKE